MGLKISISLPGNTVITLEATDPQVLHEVLTLALKDLPRDLTLIHMDQGQVRLEPGNHRPNSQGHPEEGPGGPPAQDGYPGPGNNAGTPTIAPSGAIAPSGDSREAFIHLCQSLAPMGDMRRLVVSAEAARAHLGMDAVSEVELGPLFDLAGWRRPASFIQTLRNAARTKFRWLERVPGPKGYYAVTDEGRHVVMEAPPG